MPCEEFGRVVFGGVGVLLLQRERRLVVIHKIKQTQPVRYHHSIFGCICHFLTAYAVRKREVDFGPHFNENAP